MSSKKKSKSSHSSSSSTKTPAQAISSEFKSWKKRNAESELVLEKCNAAETILELKYGSHNFTLTFPESYPSDCSGWYLFSEDDDSKMQQWLERVNDFLESGDRRLKDVLDKMVAAFSDLGIEAGGGGDHGDLDFGDEMEGHDPFAAEPEKKKESLDKVDQEVAALKFAHSTSDAATLRLIQDLKALKRSQSKHGFSAEPLQVGGKANLYHWEVRLFDFDGELAKDMAKYKAKTGKTYITLHLRFSADYPFKPPFVRVVEPVFVFHTGHVTLGGAICMQLLTNSGWKPFNDIEQIVVQIRAEIGSHEGGARLELGQDAASAYNENEAWTAYYRAAANHGWDVTGLGPQMFPKI